MPVFKIIGYHSFKEPVNCYRVLVQAKAAGTTLNIEDMSL